MGFITDKNLLVWFSRIYFFLVIGFFISPSVIAQDKSNQSKVSPVLFQQLKRQQPPEKTDFRIAIAGYDFPDEINKQEYNIKKLAAFDSLSFFIVQATMNELVSEILLSPKVLFAENAARIPKEEIQISSLDLSVNKINLLHHRFAHWNGNGITVSVKENEPDPDDIDFTGRLLTTNLSSGTISSHASVMATMIAGGGNSWHLGKGAAWGSTISSSSFATLLPDANAAYQQYNISVQNHSYGVGVENYYGADASAYDISSIDNASLLHIFSAGNSGLSSATTGMYADIPGFANLTGSFKMAKNIITVGATDSFGVVALLSSKGPAHDGRVKPELVAFGEDGSSGSAALVSGVSLVLQQAYKQLNGILPPNILIKSILINSADDIGNKEVDYSNGFGSLNAYNAMKNLQAGYYINGSVTNAGIQTFNVSIPDGIKKVKLTLVWNDPAALPNTSKALINDLDLELLYPLLGQSWKPWVLNKFPHIDSLQQLATRKRDSLNNIEQITLENPAAGDYQFRVAGFSISTAIQPFSIAYQFDSVDVFQWNFPTANDYIFSSSSNTLRWQSSFAATTGKLEFSIDNGSNWQLIDNAIDLTKGYYRWNALMLTSTALLRMNVNNEQFISDTFAISQRTLTGVGFNCTDSFLIYWNKIPGANTYRLYKLDNLYLKSLFVTTDSFAVLSKNDNPSVHYSVAPVIGNKEGVKSYTFNYTNQGVECYIRSFLASLSGNTARLSLLLGTTYNVNRVVLEKFDDNTYHTLQLLSPVNNMKIDFTDDQLKQGLNIYRIRIELANGEVIYSSTETIYNFPTTGVIIYPNPVLQGQAVNVLLADLSRTTTLQVLNATGQLVYKAIVDDLPESIPTGNLSKGFYLFRFIKEDGSTSVFKILVQ